MKNKIPEQEYFSWAKFVFFLNADDKAAYFANDDDNRDDDHDGDDWKDDN